MQDQSEEFILHPVGLFSLSACLLFDFVETRLLDSQSDAVGGHQQQAQIALIEASGKDSFGVNHADQASFEDQRRADQRASPLTQNRVDYIHGRRVFHNDWSALCGDGTGYAFSDWNAQPYHSLFRSNTGTHG